MDTFDALFRKSGAFPQMDLHGPGDGAGVLVFSSVLFRYLFNNPLEWADEVVGFFILGLTYFGSAVACGRRSQIYVEILESALKKKPGRPALGQGGHRRHRDDRSDLNGIRGLSALCGLSDAEDGNSGAQLFLGLHDHAGGSGVYGPDDDQTADSGPAQRARDE